jgi:Zn-dependent peptidase ImmA (M78 family)/transcriptional regulator with XRE-family HTH domain
MRQNDFADKLDIAPCTLSQIENGRTMPSVKLVMRMLAILGVPADAVFAEDAHEMDTELLQEPLEQHGIIQAALDGTTLTQKTHTMTTALIDAVLALEDLCQVQKQAAVSLHMPLQLSHQGLEKTASRIRQAMQVQDGVLFDYFELFESFGLRVIVAPFYRKLESVSFYDALNENAFLFINNRHNPEKQLFRLAYELGHILLLNWARRRGGYPETKPDQRLDPKHAAAKFAAFFLMPANAMRTTVAQLGIAPDGWNYDLLMRIKHRFGISAETFLYRLKELHLITPAKEKPMRKQILEHYQKTGFSEPDDTRRILTPNGRLGDLMIIAARNPRGNKEIKHIQNQLDKWDVQRP